MDLNRALYRAYFEALKPLSTPVYDAYSVPVQVDYPYVIVSDVSSSERLPNGCRVYNADVRLDIVTGFSSPKGMGDAWAIAESIKNIINPDSFADIDANPFGWEVGETRLGGSDSVQLRTGNHWIYRNLLTFRHIVYKKPLN